MTAIPIAFYAPLKSPDHPDPSGDRTMARLLLAALRQAGFAPEVASGLRTFHPAGDAAAQARLRSESEAEAGRLAARYGALPAAARPCLWFTYHSYYKAPDHLGPDMAGRLGVPYALAETSRAGKRAGGPWAIGHEAAERAIAAAAAIFVLTRHDRAALAASPAVVRRLVDLPPFVDGAGTPARTGPRPEGPVRLLAVAMMRPGDKLASYRLLGESLSRIVDRDWVLDVAGDGPARAMVGASLGPLGTRVRWHGRCDVDALHRLYAGADLLVWPAVNEAYGMALLEAQAAGCPVVAGAYGGVADALQPGETGLMPPAGDAAAFAEAVAALIDDPARRAAMGVAAARFVKGKRTLEHAAAILRDGLLPLLGASRAA